MNIIDKPKKNKPIKADDKQKPDESEQWKNKYLRALADYHNLEKRTNDQLTNGIQYAKKKFIARFLNVLDNIDRAEIFITDPGLKLVKDELLKVLKEENVMEMDILNKPFDPQLSECIAVVDGAEDGIVKEIIRKGYLIGPELLRPAQVKVTKKT